MATRIGVLADTHWVRPESWKPEVEKALKGVDLILHAGDIERLWVLQRLEQIAPVQAVVGNCDDEDLSYLLPRQRLVEVEDRRIGMLHGHDIDLARTDLLLAAFGGEVDVIIHGHTHVPILHSVPRGHSPGRVLVFNPGSTTQRRQAPARSLGLVTVDGTRIEVRHVWLENEG